MTKLKAILFTLLFTALSAHYAQAQGWDGAGNVIRSDGTSTGATTWQSARDAGRKILAADHDTHDEYLADAIEACLNRSGENSPTTAIPFGGQRITGLATATARTDAARADDVQDSDHKVCGTVAGTDTITCVLAPAITTYEVGQRFHFVAAGTNTGATTLNINGVGAIAVRLTDGATALPAGMITSGDVVEVMHDGSVFILLAPQVGPWVAWTPTVTASGTMAVGGLSVDHARYRVEGDTVHFSVRLDFNLIDPASTAVFFTLPIAPGNSRVAFTGAAVGSGPGVAVYWDSSISKVTVQLYDAGNWTSSGGAGTATRIYASGKYEL